MPPHHRTPLFYLGIGLLAFACAQSASDTDDDGGSGGTVTGPGGSGGEAASGGSTGGCAVDCSTIATSECTVAVCNDGSLPGTVGDCVIVDEPDDTSCDDGMFCTTADSCQSGTCVGGPANDCGMTPDACQEVVCDEQSQSCSTAALADGSACQTSDLCLTGSTCSGGLCLGGNQEDCFLFPVPDDCHVAQCNASTGMCEAIVGNEGQPCVDTNDLCTENKTCTAGVCTGGNPKDCSSLSVNCDVGICDTTTGQCTTQTAPPGGTCDDQNACTTGETCDSMGSCGGGTQVTTCSQTGDGCCPSNCTASNDVDCACPGTFVNNVCVYLASPNAFSFSNAQAQCQNIGTGWDLCSPTMLCDPQTLTYLDVAGCDCLGGSTACACGSANNLYIHVTGGSSPYYVRTNLVANCNWASAACTQSGSETCGAPLCCK